MNKEFSAFFHCSEIAKAQGRTVEAGLSPHPDIKMSEWVFKPT